VERYALWDESSGPGQSRGGAGVVRDYRVLADDIVVSGGTMGGYPTLAVYSYDGGAPSLLQDFGYLGELGMYFFGAQVLSARLDDTGLPAALWVDSQRTADQEIAFHRDRDTSTSSILPYYVAARLSDDGIRAAAVADLNGDGLNDLQRNNIARWNGIEGHAFGSLAYEATMGRFYLRPEARFDYLHLSEGERKESGGGTAFDVTTASRASSALNAQAAVAFGASFGRDLWWRPEIRLGYREQVAGTIGSTVAHFSTGTPFTLASADTKDGAITLDMALRAGTPMSYVALEGGVAAAKKTKRYNLRLAGRMMF
jgi:hypothetical protein